MRAMPGLRAEINALQAQLAHALSGGPDERHDLAAPRTSGVAPSAFAAAIAVAIDITGAHRRLGRRIQRPAVAAGIANLAAAETGIAVEAAEIGHAARPGIPDAGGIGDNRQTGPSVDAQRLAVLVG